MAQKAQEIEVEVEVVEIDGVPTDSPNNREHPEPGPQAKARAWQQWPGQIRQLPSFWWPVWVFLGVIALSLVLTIGLALALIYFIYWAIRRFIRALLG